MDTKYQQHKEANIDEYYYKGDNYSKGIGMSSSKLLATHIYNNNIRLIQIKPILEEFYRGLSPIRSF